MRTLKARFDGRVLVPETPLDLPVNAILEIQIVQTETALAPVETPLAELADWAEQLSGNPDLPRDGAVQHDHYLYGTPKHP